MSLSTVETATESNMSLDKVLDHSIKIPLQSCSLAATSTSLSAMSESEDSESSYSDMEESFQEGHTLKEGSLLLGEAAFKRPKLDTSNMFYDMASTVSHSPSSSNSNLIVIDLRQ
jgi:hypothetical protein